jgi:hypothetical protein
MTAERSNVVDLSPLLASPVCDSCGQLVDEVGRWRHKACEPPKPPVDLCDVCGRWKVPGRACRVDHTKGCTR